MSQKGEGWKWSWRYGFHRGKAGEIKFERSDEFLSTPKSMKGRLQDAFLKMRSTRLSDNLVTFQSNLVFGKGPPEKAKIEGGEVP